jgi:hypothetical protein
MAADGQREMTAGLTRQRLPHRRRCRAAHPLLSTLQRDALYSVIDAIFAGPTRRSAHDTEFP